MSLVTLRVCDCCDVVIWPGEESVSYPLAMFQSIDMHKSCSVITARGGYTTEHARKARDRKPTNVKQP